MSKKYRCLKDALVIVVGGGAYNDMGLVRSCGEAGMSVVLICPQPVVSVYKSRYVKEWIRIENRTDEVFLNAIHIAISKYSNKKIFIYPAGDPTALLIDQNWEELSQKAFVPHAGGQMAELMDKLKMIDLAKQSGLNVPSGYRFSTADSNPSFIEPACIVKPLQSVAGEKSLISFCRSQEELDAAVARFRDDHTDYVLIQQLIEGKNLEEVAVTGLSASGKLVETYGMIHKYRTFGNGSTVFAKYSVECPRELQDLVTRFIKSSGYSGIFDIEFLHNEDGYHFIECNYRNGAYGYAVTSAGFNMPARWAAAMLDEPLSEPHLKDRIFMEERTDLLNPLRGNIKWGEWLRDLSRTQTFLWWNWRDPRPMIRVPHIKKK